MQILLNPYLCLLPFVTHTFLHLDSFSLRNNISILLKVFPSYVELFVPLSLLTTFRALLKKILKVRNVMIDSVCGCALMYVGAMYDSVIRARH